jgi:hypothetical protein
VLMTSCPDAPSPKKSRFVGVKDSATLTEGLKRPRQ